MKDINLLKPSFKEKVVLMLAKLDEEKIPYLIKETLRKQEVQNAYFAQGTEPLESVNAKRKLAGLYLLEESENNNKVTWTLVSKHITGQAIDITPEKDGDYWWNAPDEKWKEIAEIANSCGIESGYYWKKTKDSPHYEERV